MTTASGLDIRQLHADADRDGITKLVVGAIVHTDGQVLILRRSVEDTFMAGIEELPSGGVEPGESLYTALERELGEEIGWAGPLILDPGFVARFDYISGSGRRARQYTFGAPHQGQPIVLSIEHTAYRWLHSTDLADSDVTVETARVIREWIDS
ncbi:NUDIX domain-containing protein [Actinomadura sp. KC345]|uniref:NUDIX domain-containing protein n=1 Tax=Actinomadura sp. KC345 TaxID=2530371 RepID=UPI00104A06F6|nr:NUDIX domain-containing protein [Actinomadura sp. KC345]TDC54851.1 NUDIX domain-containing protein [Actinomadura sp. KC345]